jgi:hypothetical protein
MTTHIKYHTTPSITKCLSPLNFISTLTIHLIQKIKVMKKLKYILKLHYVINHIIFDFFITLIFLIRRMVKVDVKVKSDKHLGIGGI